MTEAMWAALAAIIAAPAGYLAQAWTGKHKHKAESESILATGTNALVSSMISAIEQLRAELEETKTDLAETRRELEKTRTEADELRQEVHRLRSELHRRSNGV